MLCPRPKSHLARVDSLPRHHASNGPRTRRRHIRRQRMGELLMNADFVDQESQSLVPMKLTLRNAARPVELDAPAKRRSDHRVAAVQPQVQLVVERTVHPRFLVQFPKYRVRRIELLDAAVPSIRLVQWPPSDDPLLVAQTALDPPRRMRYPFRRADIERQRLVIQN